MDPICSFSFIRNACAYSFCPAVAFLATWAFIKREIKRWLPSLTILRFFFLSDLGVNSRTLASPWPIRPVPNLRQSFPVMHFRYAATTSRPTLFFFVLLYLTSGLLA